MKKNGSKNTEQTVIVWQPQAGPQTALVNCPFAEILYGGARGGGKTEGILGKYALKGHHYGKAFNAIFFRREMPQQDDLIERAKEIYLPIGASWYEQKKLFVLSKGGRIRFRPLENVVDADKYQGQNLTDAAVEEAGNYPDSAAIDRLFGCLRSKHGVPIQLILTANPGGAGHSWIKSRYVDPAPLGFVPLIRKLPSGAEHRYVFIPSKVENNKILLAKDPGYIDRLHLTGSPALVRAWLDGDWNVVTGAYFPEFGTHHIIEPFAIPSDWIRFRSFDWGSAAPFGVCWFAVSDGTLNYPKNALIQYREWYGASSPGVGLKLTVGEVAEGIKKREMEALNYSVADPSIFKEDGGPSIAERMKHCGINFRAGDNKRISGWDAVRARLKGQDGKPMYYVFSTCIHTIRTFPIAQHDSAKPEDMDSTGDDHLLDAIRYASMSRPYSRPVVEQQPMRTMRDMTLNELWEKEIKRIGERRL